ncbi:MAG: porin family protein [Hyphomicrobiales bacterium]|nr:porin family protein [Hyphomicrobiales bacterium]
MTNRWLIGAAAAALAVTGAFGAQAADLPTRKMAPAPVFVPPPFTWTGFYIGVNAGAIWGSGNVRTNVFAPAINPFGALITTDFPLSNFGSSPTGFIGGGQAGYNWQTGAWVFGVETDFDGTTLKRSGTIIGPTFLNPLPPFGNDFFIAHGSARLDWLGSTRGRVGFVATPDNRLMFYGTGGVAYGGGSTNLTVYDNVNGWFWSGSGSSTRVGWTAGAGVEYAFTNNIILGAEYLYTDLGSRTFSAVPNPAASAFFGTNVYSVSKVNFNFSEVRARLSYKF